MKKVLINIALIFIMIIIYFLQANFFSWFTIAGIQPNLFIIFILFIGLFGNKLMGSIYGIILGMFLDYLFLDKVGIYMFGYGLIGFLAYIFDKNFSKDSRMTMMFMVVGATILFELITYILKYIFLSYSIEIFEFIKILIIETAYNMLITIIVYPLIQKFGYYIENEYKRTKILTRYF